MARILIVDNRSIEVVIKEDISVLRKQGHFVKHAINAFDAKYNLQKKSYDLAIIDLSEDSYISSRETLSESMKRCHPSTIRICWSAQYSLYQDINERFHYKLSKRLGGPVENILGIIKKENL